MSRIPTLAQRWASPQGVAGLLLATAHARPGAAYLEDRFGTRLSYAETAEAARRLAVHLASRGVGRGDRVAIHLENRAEVAVALYAASLLGAVFVVLNAGLRPKGLAKIFAQAEPAAAIVDAGTVGNLAECGGGLPLVFAGEGEPPAGAVPWAEALEHAPGEVGWPGVDVDAATLVFTSGSTGEPRGVALSHDNVCYAVGAIQARLGYRSEDTVGCFLPLAFDYGLYQILLAAQAGARLFLGDPSQVGPRLPRILREAEVSVLPGVPSISAALISLGRRRPLQLPALRALTNTGERLPRAYIEELRTLLPGLEIFVMYGLTECKRVSILLPAEYDGRRDSVGRPLDGTEVYAVDEAGERLPPGETGELVVRGRHVALGYWRAPEETARRFRKRSPGAAVELFTGDTGSVDAEGFLYFSSRSDDLLKHRGNRISPVEIENEACALDGVVEASLLQRESDDTLHLFVTVSDAAVTPAKLQAALAETLEPAKVPDRVAVLADLPKSINGKIDRKALASALQEGAEA